MKELSDFELRRVLQEKLGDLEGDVSSENEEKVLAALNRGVVQTSGLSKSLLYLLLGLIVVLPVTYYSFKGSNSELTVKDIPPTLSAPQKSSMPTPAVSLPEKASNQVGKTNGSSGKFNGQLLKSNPNTTSQRPGAYSWAAGSQQAGLSQASETMMTENGNEWKAAPQATEQSSAKDSLVKEVVKDSAVPEDSVASPKQADEKKRKKIWLAFSVQPFLNYKNAKPNTDGIYVSNFSFPSTLSTDRLGVKLSAALDFEVATNKFLTAGLSWFSYHSTFSYQANESANGITPLNTVDETIQGVSLSLGGKYPLKMGNARNQFITGGIDFQQVTGTAYPQGLQMMVNLGYANYWRMGKGELRVTPLFSYSITRLTYPGVAVQPYWAGVELGYALPIRK